MPKKPGEIYEQVRDGVVAIRTLGGSGGSGVVVGDNEVVTNCHVIDDGAPIVVGKVDPNDGQWDPVQAHVIAASPDDICLLRAPGLSAKPLDIGITKELRVGDSVYTVGAPGNLPLTFSGGFVSQLRRDPEFPMIQTDAAISHGSSGGGLFNGEGQLVGITHMSRGGQNLNFALPADFFVKFLRDCAQMEAPIRQKLVECLDTRNAAEISAGFRQVAGGIRDTRENPAHRAFIFGRMVREEARAGDRDSGYAKHIAEWATASDSQQDKDRVNFEAAWCFACVGNFNQADKTAEEIKDDGFQLAARAVISAEQARSGDIDAARARFGQTDDIHEQAEGENLGLMAWAFAEMNQVKEALDCMEKIQQSKSKDFVGEMRALSSIASALTRNKCKIGGNALFRNVRDAFNESEGAHNLHGRGERVLSLGHVAWEEADCGNIEQARESTELAMKIIAEGGIDHEDYHMKIEAQAKVAEVLAKIGELKASMLVIRRIPVLSDEFAVAIAYIAIAMGRRNA